MQLYIHIPFCDSKCSYCSFNSYVDKFELKSDYMRTLHRQLLHELERFQVTPKALRSIFIGGGTPSTVAPYLYEEIFKTLRPFMACECEVTTEANPNSATHEWLSGMYALGVNRVSFGVQSFDDKKLKLLHRAHSPFQAIKAINSAADIGFKNISCDLIYATYGDTQELLKHDLDIAFSLPINHISAYALTIESGTAFSEKPQMACETLELTKWLFGEIEAHGFSQYEISNFGSYQSLHNKGYWEYRDYLGVGCGAVGKLENKRYYPKTNIEEYLNDPLDIEVEELSDEDIKTEKIFLGLRSNIGLSREILTSKEIERAELLAREGKLTSDAGRYFNKEYLLSDELALFIQEY